MPASLWTPGAILPEPGVGFRITRRGGTGLGGLPFGVAAAVFASSWGPVGVVTDVFNVQQAKTVFGDDATAKIVQDAIDGGATKVRCVRLGGSGAAAGSKNLLDTTGSPITAATFTNRYPGDRVIGVTITDNLADGALRDFKIWEQIDSVWTLRQVVSFKKRGSSPADPAAVEPTELANAFAAAGSDWGTIAFVAAGSNILATISSPSAVSGGVDPTPANGDYSTAFAALGAARGWNELIVDTASNAIHLIVASFITNQINSGNFVSAVVGQNTSVAIATRLAESAAFNHFGMSYVINGFTAGGVNYEGYRAAARYAGMIVTKPVSTATTRAVVTGATAVYGTLTDQDRTNALTKGAIVFASNSEGQVWVVQGLTTFITETGDYDAGWKKKRRQRTRFKAIQLIADTADKLAGVINNDPDGHATVLGIGQQVATMMTNAREIRSLEMELDESIPAQGESATFRIGIVDMDSLEKLYFTFEFQYDTA
jgi:hypothetical protein